MPCQSLFEVGISITRNAEGCCLDIMWELVESNPLLASQTSNKDRSGHTARIATGPLRGSHT